MHVLLIFRRSEKYYVEILLPKIIFRQQGTHCVLIPPWPGWPSWAGLRYLRWIWQWIFGRKRGGTFHVRAKQGIVSTASGPALPIWRTHVHTRGLKTYPSRPCTLFLVNHVEIYFQWKREKNEEQVHDLSPKLSLSLHIMQKFLTSDTDICTGRLLRIDNNVKINTALPTIWNVKCQDWLLKREDTL